MDGEESDSSESYFSAGESLQPAKEDRFSVVSTTEDSEKSSTERSINEQKTGGVETTTLRKEEGLRVPCTSLISKDSGTKATHARRRRVRHNSETTKVRDSFVINHALNGMNTLYVLWANDKLCDTTVTVEGKEFPAHSVVLATHSDYFLSLLVKEQTGANLPRRISIDGLVSAPGFGRLLSYMYTSEIDLRWGNVCSIMQTANSLNMARVVELGREFLQNYNIESCLNALFESKQANLDFLHANIRNFVLDNFTAVSRTKGFLKCPAETLASLMTDDDVNVDSELDILLAAKTWICHNGKDGLKNAPILIKQVRFHNIPSTDLKKYVEGDDQLMQIPEVKSKVMAVYRQRTTLATTSGTSERSQRRPKEKTTFDDVSKLILTSAWHSRDRLHMAKKGRKTLQQNESDTLHEANFVSEIPTTGEPPPRTSSASSSLLPQPQPETQIKSDQPLTKTSQILFASTNVPDNISLQQNEPDTFHEANLVSQTPTSSEPTLSISSASSSSLPQPQPEPQIKPDQPLAKKSQILSASTNVPDSKSLQQNESDDLSHEANFVSPTPISSESPLSTASSSSLSQPELQIKSLAKTSQILSASTNVPDSLHSEVHISKKANLITQTAEAPLHFELASPGKTSSSMQEGVSKSSQQPPVKKPQSPEPWPMPKTAQGVNVTLKSAKKPRKNVRNYFAPRLTSDYRITASNPKALASGPIAWPVTQHTEKKRRHDVIVTVGGVAKSGESEVMGRSVEAFILDKNKWREMTQLPAARNHHVVHFLSGFVYVVGGSDPHADGDDFLKPVKSVLKYEVRSGQWSEAQPMNTARVFHELTAMFGQLYVVGGQDHAGCTLATVECYSPSTDRWRYVASLPSPRYGMAVTVYHGQLWVAGGFPEDSLAETSTVPTDVVCYNAFRDEWTLVTRLRVPRCHTSLLKMADRLYMIGGFVGESSDSEDKDQSLSTIEMYDERTDEWVFVTDLWQGRHDANTVTVGDKAYIIGGMDDENEDPLPNMECFDPIAMSWVNGLAALPSARFGHACCVIPADARIKWAKS